MPCASTSRGDDRWRLPFRGAAKHAGPSLYTEHVTLAYGRFFDCLPAAHLQFFETLRVYHRTDDCLCSHADLDPTRGEETELFIYDLAVHPDH